jgi:magnesium transporter
MLEASPQLLSRGSAWLAHAFIDAVIDRFLPFMDLLQRRIDDAELQVMTAPASEGGPALPEIIALKRSIQALCRIAHHQRDILLQLSHADYSQIPKEARPYVRDVYDHFTRVAEDAELYKDVVTNVVDAHMNMQSNRMNDTVKRLTLISTMLLPLNVITSFYGMNFTSLPGLSSPWGALVVVGAMVAVTVLVWTYFRVRRWA